MKNHPSCIQEKYKLQMIDALVSQRYTMIIKKKYSYLNIDCDIKVTNLKKINDSKFKIQMEGKDRIG
jgi:2C-methyl-D-erythritol 2,4-cyclodiphosphate synthase